MTVQDRQAMAGINKSKNTAGQIIAGIMQEIKARDFAVIVIIPGLPGISLVSMLFFKP
jgi:hypothetical protein